MTTAARVPPSDRFFAHLEKFACACPNCGAVLEVRGSAHQKPNKHKPLPPINHRLWNPVTQRLRCQACHGAFVAGLLLYPLAGRYAIDPPPDVVRRPSERRQERLEARRLAGGWCAQATHRNGTAVNLHVTEGCSCPVRGWSSDCALHGGPAPVGP